MVVPEQKNATIPAIFLPSASRLREASGTGERQIARVTVTFP
jgi:hypothetical protein